MEARFKYTPQPEARWPHRFAIISKASFGEVQFLCKPPRDWCAEQSMFMWIDVNGTFFFKYEADALAFRLRWT